MTRIALGSIVVVAGLAIVACGGDDSPGTGAGATASAAPTTGPAGSAAPTTGSAASASPARAGVRLVGVGTFDAPVYVTAPPGDRRRIFVVQQGGTIRVVRAGRKLATPFLDVRSRVISGGEQGLLSMAFAPDYATTRRFYVNYTDTSGKQRIVEYRSSKSDPDRAYAASARVVLRYDGIEPNHNGGLLVFGPDRLLYAGTGDGGGENDRHGAHGNGQDLGKLEGKLLRIDPRRSATRPYSVPASNPFVGRSGARPEIYSYGLRNPWRFSFDRSTGDLAIGDVGQDHVEEIDFARRGAARGVNYGWRPLEGTRVNYPGETAPGAVAPVLQLQHSAGNCSITGGYVVRDPKLPALRGRYVYGDFCKGDLRSVRLAPGSATGDRSLGLHVDDLSSFGEDALGRVYVVSLGGAVSRLAAG